MTSFRGSVLKYERRLFLQPCMKDKMSHFSLGFSISHLLKF